MCPRITGSRDGRRPGGTGLLTTNLARFWSGSVEGSIAFITRWPDKWLLTPLCCPDVVALADCDHKLFLRMWLCRETPFSRLPHEPQTLGS